MKYQRELTAGILIPAVLLILIRGPLWAWAILVAVAATLALLEFYGLIAAAGWVAPRWAGLVMFAALLAAAYVRSPGAVVALAALTLFLLPTLVMFASPPEAILLPSSASSVFATLYVAAGAGAMIGLREFGWKPILVLLAIVWIGDSAAYYVGKKWGRKKLAPVVSPKKTWAGFFGQLGAGTVLGAAVIAVADARPPSAASVAVAAGLGLLVSILATVGDLVESTFKRSCAVKDSGGLLPGHGGLLDRLDSLLYTSPAMLAVAVLAPGAMPK